MYLNAMQCGGGDAMFLSLAPAGESWMVRIYKKSLNAEERT